MKKKVLYKYLDEYQAIPKCDSDLDLARLDLSAENVSTPNRKPLKLKLAVLSVCVLVLLCMSFVLVFLLNDDDTSSPNNELPTTNLDVTPDISYFVNDDVKFVALASYDELAVTTDGTAIEQLNSNNVTKADSIQLTTDGTIVGVHLKIDVENDAIDTADLTCYLSNWTLDNEDSPVLTQLTTYKEYTVYYNVVTLADSQSEYYIVFQQNNTLYSLHAICSGTITVEEILTQTIG